MHRLWKAQIEGTLGVIAICCGCQAQDVSLNSIAASIHKYELLVHQAAPSREGATWWTLARLYQDAARYVEAERAYNKALSLLREQDPVALASAMDCMGTMFAERGKYNRAEPLERQALLMREAQHDQLGVGLSWMHLAVLSLGEHHVSDAAMYAQWAVDRIVTKPSRGQNEATPEQKMTALIDLALTRCAGEDCSAALIPLTRASELAKMNYPTRSFPAAYIEFLVGYAHWKSGDLELAAEQMKNGTSGMYAQLGWGHPAYLAAMEQYANFLKKTRRRTEATEARQQIARVRKAQKEH